MTAMMSLGLLELYQNCGKYLINFNDEEKEVIMTLANMKFGTTKRLCAPPMAMADGKSSPISNPF